jgi:hypothetical protein
MPLDSPDGVCEHGADFAGSEMPESNEDEFVLLLVPGAVQEHGVDVRIQPQVGGGVLQDGDGAGLRSELALLSRTPCVEPLHRLFEDPRERAEQGARRRET